MATEICLKDLVVAIRYGGDKRRRVLKGSRGTWHDDMINEVPKKYRDDESFEFGYWHANTKTFYDINAFQPHINGPRLVQYPEWIVKVKEPK